MVGYGFPRGPNISRISPIFFSLSNFVPLPLTWIKKDILSFCVSKIEKGRLKRGLKESIILIAKNCPGLNGSLERFSKTRRNRFSLKIILSIILGFNNCIF